MSCTAGCTMCGCTGAARGLEQPALPVVATFIMPADVVKSWCAAASRISAPS